MAQVSEDNLTLVGYDLRTLFGSVIPEGCFTDWATGGVA